MIQSTGFCDGCWDVFCPRPRKLPEAESEVVRIVRERAARGFEKYGTTTDREDLSRLDWLKHARDEALDLAVYLQRLINEGAPDA